MKQNVNVPSVTIYIIVQWMVHVIISYDRYVELRFDLIIDCYSQNMIINFQSQLVLSRFILSSRKTVQHGEYNALLMQWGQYLIHEMAKTTLVPSAKCNVCKNIRGRCMTVPILPKDPNKTFKSNRCIRVSRSSAICGSGKQKPRQQLNENTNFIDGSPIYGSSVGDLHKFREGKTGFLKTVFFNGLRLLPFDIRKCRNAASCSAIFVAGDSRVNLFMGLSSYHIILTREHNRNVLILLTTINVNNS
ncbi:heme peroxidase [Wuchereria bancrofti]|uniref:Heme peroxidase n=1 Tax=Wuchereria bancrofti TaxID=6293 RepID=J9EZ86_WUCBA|nr:heme peroxidase [Wuchereria bancrofti]